MPTAPINRCYVFGMSPSGQPVLAGEMTLERTLGYFRYDASWLAYDHHYPLDPVNIPLDTAVATCRLPDRVFLVFSDAAPDAWGTQIMLLQHSSRPQNELERLLRTSGRGVGTLQYSLSRSRPKRPEPAADISFLQRLAEVAESIESADVLDAEMLRLIEPGSSMGGARPKVTVSDGPREYLAKFARPSDMVDIPKVEFATMRMLKDTRLAVPDVRLEPVGGGRSAFLIERFDVFNRQTTHHYVSAHALFNRDRVRELPDGHRDPAGYVALANHLRRHSANFAHDGEQLFLRALTNIALGNTDDHARNFGMVYGLADRQWCLAPVFDVMPILSGFQGKQAMSLGIYGRESSWRNLVSCIPVLGLTEDRAGALAREHLAVLNRWADYYRDAGVSAKDERLLRMVVDPHMASLNEALGGTHLLSYDLDNMGTLVPLEPESHLHRRK